jgi:hypothetical protein
MDVHEVTIAGVLIAVASLPRDHEGRTVYAYGLNGGGLNYADRDLKSGCQGGTAKEGMASLLCFLQAAGESHPDPEASFPPAVCEWAAANQDELALAQLDIEEPQTDE